MRPLISALLLLIAPSAALAQDGGGFNAHGFNLVPQDGDLRDGLSLYRPGSLGAGEWFAGGLVEYANRPLLFITERAGEEPQTAIALNHLAVLHATGGIALHERARLGLTAPIYFTSTGFDGTQGPTLGDLRADGLFLISMPDEDRLGLGIAGWLDLPTGSTDRYLGRRTVAGGFSAIGTYELDRWTFTGNLGLQLEPTVDFENFKGADTLLTGAGARYLLSERSSLGLEALMRSALTRNEVGNTGSPAEAILSFKHRDPGGAYVTAGLAAPLSQGVGAAAWRIFLGGGFGRMGPVEPRDRDGDGIPDKLDACPDEPETFNDYIDEDGCPDALATLRVVVRYQGQPVEGADLLITGPQGEERAMSTGSPLDRQVVPETLWQVEAKKGACLQGSTRALVNEGIQEAMVDLALLPSAAVRVTVTDASGQPVPNARLLWESENMACLPDPPDFDTLGTARAEIGAGEHRIIVGAPGYRVSEVPFIVERGDELEIEVKLQTTKLRVEKKRIVILDKVQFEFNKATIKPESFELLDEVADVIRRNPQAGRVEVQGHTDNRGRAAYNLELSDRRAKSVRDYLIEHGVAPERLLARGFGLTTPIATNDTEAGRATNRRVEFVLIDQADQQIEEPADAE